MELERRERAAIEAPRCTVRGCDRGEMNGGKAAGLCRRHYESKVQTGDPVRMSDRRRWFFDELIANPTNECVIWPFDTVDDGYGIHGNVRAHRHALMLLTERNPKGLVAAHGPCHNRMCVNPHPEHGMRWSTHLENMRDRIRDGTTLKGETIAVSKLTAATAREAHARYAAGELVNDIARDLGVKAPAILAVTSGRTWRHLGLPVLPRRSLKGVPRGKPGRPVTSG